MILPSPARLHAKKIKQHADFFAIASRYTRLRRAGRQFVGFCPFHTESTPSFYVELVQKIWKCFGCDRGGDVFDFIMRAENCDFPTALQIVAGVAPGSEPRSGERFARSEGGEAPLARAAGGFSSRNEHARLVARLDATEARLQAIRATNNAASAALATACEPRSGEHLLEYEG